MRPTPRTLSHGTSGLRADRSPQLTARRPNLYTSLTLRPNAAPAQLSYVRTLRELCERDGTDLDAPHVGALLHAEQVALSRYIQRHSYAATSHGGVQLASTGDVHTSNVCIPPCR